MKCLTFVRQESFYIKTENVGNLMIIKFDKVFLILDMNITILCRFPPDKQRLYFLFLGITKRYITNVSRAPSDRFIRQCYS